MADENELECDGAVLPATENNGGEQTSPTRNTDGGERRSTECVSGDEAKPRRSACGNRDWLCVTLVLLSCIVGTLLMRIISYFMPAYSTYGGYLLSQAAFSLPVQLLLFLGIPFAIYTYVGKRSVKQTLKFSSATRFKPEFLLALPLGMAVFSVTIGVSSGWTGLLRMTGYTPSSGSPDLPDSFVPGYFVAEVLMTAVLPAVCEEFAMRGGLLSTVRRGYGKAACIMFCAVMFGLFHQNIRQVFYTSLFGALAAFLVCETDSIFPAAIMHFTNNFCSVYFDYAARYGWLGGGLFGWLGAMPGWAFLAIIATVGLIGAAIVILMLYVHDKSVLRERKRNAEYRTAPAEGEIVVSKPRNVEAAGIVALASIALITTVFTYVWGFLY